MTSEQHETADTITKLKAVLACCDDLEGSAEIAADLAAIRCDVNVMLHDFETEFLTAGVDESVLIRQFWDRLLALDARCRGL